MFKEIKDICKVYIYDFLYIPIYFRFVYFKDLKGIERHYSGFEKLGRSDIKKYIFSYDSGKRNVCGGLMAEISKVIDDLAIKPKNVLLDGDSKETVEQFRKRFNFDSSKILTVGIGNDFDYDWNFENDPPENLPNNFDLIVSQAMLEHLLNPYKHFSDLVNSLNKGGLIIIHSVMPGYTYHRYPIDAMRFYPDWFEASAERLKLKVVRKIRRDFHLIYLFKK